MQLFWGGYSFLANSLRIGSETEALLGEDQLPYAYRVDVTVSGYLQGDGQADLSAKEASLRSVMRVQHQDLLFKDDSGNNTAVSLVNAQTVRGVTITKGPDFPGEEGPEYVNQRKFSFTATAEFAQSNNLTLIAWRETLEFSGGGPLYAHKRAINGPPQKQLIYPQTEYVVVQSGEAVGYTDYPVPPPSKWPADLKQNPRITRVGPDKLGANYRFYRVAWEYIHESVNPMVGVPALWPAA